MQYSQVFPYTKNREFGCQTVVILNFFQIVLSIKIYFKIFQNMLNLILLRTNFRVQSNLEKFD